MTKKQKRVEFPDTIYVKQVTDSDCQYLAAAGSFSDFAYPDAKVRVAVYKLHEVGEVVADTCFFAE